MNRPGPLSTKAKWAAFIGEWITFLLRLLAECWPFLQRRLRALDTLRVSLWTVVIACGALLVTGQGQDMYLEIAEDLALTRVGRWSGLLVGTPILALMAWYAGRVAVTVVGRSSVPYEVFAIRRRAPRWIGYLVFLLVAAGLTRAAIRSGNLGSEIWLGFAGVTASTLLITDGWLNVLEAHYTRVELERWLRRYFLFVLLFFIPGVFIGGVFVSGQGTSLRLLFLAAIVLLEGSFYLLFVRLRRVVFGFNSVNRDTGKLRASSREKLGWLGGICVLIFLGLAIWPVQIGRWAVGPVFLLLVGLCWPIGLGTLLTTKWRRDGFPIVTSVVGSILLLMAIAAPWNDGHNLRVVRSTAIEERPTISELFAQWMTDRRNQGRTDASGGSMRTPVFIVATEGGGSRAAYWTATVLGRIEDRSEQEFSRHLLAISSVSGGSFGSVTFRALVGRNNPSAEALGQQITGDNHLGPQLARLLTIDLLQLPLLAPWINDRGVALEWGREASWERFVSTEDNPFEEPFLSLGSHAPLWPALFINSTLAESGRRAVVSNVRLRRPDSPPDFDEVLDLLEEIGQDMPLSTAGETSSRFPYMSPPGTFQTKDGERGHLVDGGYFENFGAATALDVLDALAEDLERNTDIAPIVIQISNNIDLPANVGDWENRTRGPVRARNYEPITVGLETTTPPRTLLATRNARGWSDTERLRRAVRAFDGRYIHFRLSPETRVPTGRILSIEAREALRTDADSPANGRAFQTILGYLANGVPNADPEPENQ